MPHTDKKKANDYRVKWGRNKSFCECGQLISNGGKYSHMRSKLHLEAMARIDLVDNPKLELSLSKRFPRLTPHKLKRIISIILE